MRWEAVCALVIGSLGASCTSRSPDQVSIISGKGAALGQFGRALSDNPIPAENQLPGNPEWRDGWSSYSRELEVYLSTDSQSPGGFVSVKVSADGPTTITAEVYRLAIDSQDNLYVAEIAGSRIRMIRAGTAKVITYAGNGGSDSRDGDIGINASFSAPSALGVAPTGEIYVLDGYSQYIRRISPAGAHRVDTIAGQFYAGVGHVDGPGTWARFRGQLGMVVTSAGEILLADTGNYRIRKIVPGASADSTSVSTIAGSGRAGTRLGSGDVSDIVAPAGLAIPPDQRLIVSDSYNNVLRQIPLSTRPVGDATLFQDDRPLGSSPPRDSCTGSRACVSGRLR
jgi:hypothetical protein